MNSIQNEYCVSTVYPEMLLGYCSSTRKALRYCFCVGLSFSRVLLRKEAVKDGVVEVNALQQQVWLNSWPESEMANFSLLLFNSTMVSTQFQEDVSYVTAISPSWISNLYDFLSCSGHAGKDCQDKDMESGYNHGSLSATTDLDGSDPSSSRIAKGTTSHDDPHHNQGQELPEVTATERGMQSQPLQLTIIIYLDPQDCTYFLGPQTARPPNSAAGEMRLDTEASIPRFVHCQTGEALSIDVDPVFCKFPMVPEVTIKFLYDPRLEGSGGKQMTTTLDVNFLMGGTASDDPTKFGWYHDQLRLSFQCKRPNAVRRQPRDLETEILSEHEIRTADIVHARGNSTAAMKGRNYQTSAGIGNIANLQMGNTSSQESTVRSNENQELSSRISALCLVGANFCIQKVEGYSELAYLATTFPPFHQYSARNLDDRGLANVSGMMSAVRIGKS